MNCERLGCGKEINEDKIHFCYDFDGGTAHYCSYKCALEALAEGIHVWIPELDFGVSAKAK